MLDLSKLFVLSFRVLDKQKAGQPVLGSTAGLCGGTCVSEFLASGLHSRFTGGKSETECLSLV